MHYLVVNRDGERLGKFSSESQATEVAQRYSDNGVYVSVECYDNDTTSRLLNFVFSSNETNWIGRNGNWNTNA